MDVVQRPFGHRRLIQVLLLILFIAFMIALFVRRPIQEQAAIRSMPEAERRATFEKELAAFRSLCVEGPSKEFDARCREHATFLQQFPECDEMCRKETDRFLSHPSR